MESDARRPGHQENTVHITRSSINTVPGPADWFTGHVHIDAVAAAPPPSRVTANLVINEADADHAVVHWLAPVTDDEYTAAPAVD